MADPRLAPFRELNARRPPWEERAKVIRQQFPSVAELDWRKAFALDIGLFGRIIEDILKADVAADEPGKPGPRPALDYADGVSRLRQLWGLDYSTLPFPQAIKALTRHRGFSFTMLARKTAMSRSKLHRLAQGIEEPTAVELEQIAKAFGKHPSYFTEWRMAFVVAALYDQMEDVPEASIRLYRKMRAAISEAS